MDARRTPGRGAAALALTSALWLGGCQGGADDGERTRVPGDAATVYASVPRAGVSAASARTALAGMRHALEQQGARAGGLRIRLRVLASTDGAEHAWDPGAVSANAERAADDPGAIAYVGELDYGATAVSLPITNEAGLLQVSPADGLTSLTRRPPGRPRAGPERYYPSERRSFARVGPTDLDEAERLVERAARAGAERVAIVFDRDIYGRELAGQLITRARETGIEVVGAEQYGGDLDRIPDLAAALAESRPDAVLHAGVAGRGSGRLLAAIDARLPGVPLYAASGLLARSTPIPAAPDEVEVVAPALSAERAGHAAMQLVLRAVEAGGRDRRRVVREGVRLGRAADPWGFELQRLAEDGRFERAARLP